MRATGSMFGLAYGDALGKPVEFKKYPAIVAAFGPGGPTELPKKALVTDDTQMALAVGWALLQDGDLVQNLDNRAPGNTSALHAALRHPDDSVAALGRACATNGDSDSIACLAGAFHGGVWDGCLARAVEQADRIPRPADPARRGLGLTKRTIGRPLSDSIAAAAAVQGETRL